MVYLERRRRMWGLSPDLPPGVHPGMDDLRPDPFEAMLWLADGLACQDFVDQLPGRVAGQSVEPSGSLRLGHDPYGLASPDSGEGAGRS